MSAALRPAAAGEGAGEGAARGAPGRRRAWLALYAVATFLSFPHEVAGRVLDLGLVFAWVGPACLWLGLDGLAPRRAARAGFLAGLVAHGAILHWIYVVTVVYGKAPGFVGVLAPIGLAVYPAAFAAAFGAGAAGLGRLGLANPFALAALWAALDHARHHLLSGFPWAVLGYAQHRNAALMPLAAWTAVHGLSFVTALASFAALELLRARRRPAPRAAWAALALVLAAHLAGLAARARERDAAAGSVRVALLQGNIDQDVKWSPEWAERTLEIYEALAREAAAQGAQLIVWPETAVPGSLDFDAAMRERVEELVRSLGAVQVIGGVGIERHGEELRFFDSAFVFDAGGVLRDRYDKAHLVPFGEYVPLREVLGLLVSAVARGIAPDNVTQGPGARAVVLELGAGAPSGAAAEPGADPPPRRGALPAGVPICYELLFPDLVRGFVADGAALLLAITNDAWYGRTGAPHQFLAITALRAAETRSWLGRAANTGVSAIIDDRGRVREATRIFQRGVLVADVPLRSATASSSFYVRHGDVFAWACWAGLGGLGILGALRRGGGEGE